MARFERIAERLLCQSELSALGPIAKRQVLAGKGPKPQVGLQAGSEARPVTKDVWTADVSDVSLGIA